MLSNQILQEIMEIDIKIINLIHQRFNFIPKLLSENQKLEKNIIFLPTRENQMHRKYWEHAIKLGLNPEFIRKIFDLIFNEMDEIQERELINEYIMEK
ncbi:chorismate mutase [Candidatus Harpocratesius sp.]